jgi:DNA-binding transcriptional ArsR family regulator
VGADDPHRRLGSTRRPEELGLDGSGMRTDDVDTVFAALSDPTRRRLLDQLSHQGPMTATQLASSYPVSRQAVVKHLGTLAAAGLLDVTRSGREVRYGVIPGRLGGASAWLADVGNRWDRRLDALRRQLGDATSPGAPTSGPISGD